MTFEIASTVNFFRFFQNDIGDEAEKLRKNAIVIRRTGFSGNVFKDPDVFDI